MAQRCVHRWTAWIEVDDGAWRRTCPTCESFQRQSSRPGPDELVDTDAPAEVLAPQRS